MFKRFCNAFQELFTRDENNNNNFVREPDNILPISYYENANIIENRNKNRNRIKIKSDFEVYKYNSTLSTFNECSICIEHFADKEDVIKLECGHIFHKDCILEWFNKKKYTNLECPNCNFKIR